MGTFTDIPAASGGGSPYWSDPVATAAALPVIGSYDGEIIFVKDELALYEWDDTGGLWLKFLAGLADVAGPASSADNQLALFSGTTGKILKAASSITASRALVSDGSGVPTHSTVTATTLAFLDATSSVQTQLNAKVNKAGDTMSGALLADGGVDVTATGGTDTLSIGTTNADVINIGRSGATVNVQGTTAYQDVTNYQVTDKNITVNKGGSAGSGSGAGIEIEEGGSATGYAQTSANRNSWELKAPNTAGIATITPGAGGITLNQSSHDPVTLGTANGLSLAGQQLSLDQSSGSTTGALTSTDWTTFNNKVSTTRTISTTAPLTGGGDLSANRTIAIPKATGAVDGYLASTDFSTFNSKVDGPASVTDERLCRFDGTTGKLIQQSSWTEDDNGGISTSSTTAFIRLPNMTTTQRDALTPLAGMMIFNTTVNRPQVYLAAPESSWVNMVGWGN